MDTVDDTAVNAEDIFRPPAANPQPKRKRKSKRKPDARAIDCSPEQESEEEEKEKPKLRDITIWMLKGLGVEPFMDSKKKAYLMVPINKGKNTATWAVDSEDFRRFVHKVFEDNHGVLLPKSVISDVIAALDAKAAYSGNKQEVHIRIAHHNGHIYVDLADDTWRAVHITSAGWNVCEKPPVRFLRPAGLLPLPEPKEGVKIEDGMQLLRSLINTPDEADWQLFVGWIVGAYSQGPYAHLFTSGEQGCAKSTLCEIARQLVDPSVAPKVTNPRESRDVVMAAVNSRALSIDNLSSMPLELSDLFCCLSTGAAHRERAYHTNDGTEQIFVLKCPAIINGIALALKPDLGSRSIVLNLNSISDDKRREETEMRNQFEAAQPAILSAIFSVLSGILAELPTTTLSKKPRMADFAKWITAAEKSLGWETGSFVSAFMNNQADAAEAAIADDSFINAVCVFMEDQISWKGNWCDLSLALDKTNVNIQTWPQEGKNCTNRLKRYAPNLKAQGVHWRPDRKGRGRGYFFWNTNKGGTDTEDDTEPALHHEAPSIGGGDHEYESGEV
jgi:hypothetical protein